MDDDPAQVKRPARAGGSRQWDEFSLVKPWLIDYKKRIHEFDGDYPPSGPGRGARGGTMGGIRLKEIEVRVVDNDVEKAIRLLKKKIQNDGLFKRLKLKKSYEKPSEFRRRKKREAKRRERIAAARAARRR